MATWVFRRIKGELRKLGYQVSATSIRGLLRRHRGAAGAAAVGIELAAIPAGSGRCRPSLRFLASTAFG